MTTASGSGRPGQLVMLRTPLIGWTREIERVCSLLLDERRLGTLIGPGGVGKTRLALAVAARAESAYAAGVRLISLAAGGSR